MKTQLPSRSSWRMRLALCSLLFSLATVSWPLTASPAGLTPLTVSTNPFVNNAPIFIALEEGDFAAQGIEVRLVQFREPSQNLAALIAGQLDVHAGPLTAGFMQAVLQGAKLRIVADKGHAGLGERDITFMVRQDLIDSGRYRNLKDLRGMRIGVPFRGGIIEMFVLQILRNRALLTEQDVTFQQIPGVVLPDALRNKALDASPIPEPSATRLESLGVAKVVATLHDIFPRSQYAMIVYGPNLIVRNPGLGQRFMNGYLRGIQRYQVGKTDRNIAIIRKHTNEDESLLRKMLWPLFHPDGHLNVESLLQTQAWWVREGWLDRALTADQFIELSFARRAYRLLQPAP